MSRIRARFRGIIVPTLTPLTDDERVDSVALERQLGFLIDSGVDALFILGSNGEGAMLRSSTRLSVVEESMRIASSRIPVIAGVLEISTARIMDELWAMRGLGVETYVVTTPLYYRDFGEDDLYRHFEAIASEADAPILLYNIPQFTGTALSESLIRKLANVPNIVGLKDSSGNWTVFQNLLLDRPRPDFALLQGLHQLGAVSLFAGADGLVPGYANVHPSLFVDMLRATRDGRWSDALDYQRTLNRLLAIRGPGGHHANKVLGKGLGLMDDHVSSPLPRLTEVQAKTLLMDSLAAGLPVRDARAYEALTMTGGPNLD